MSCMEYQLFTRALDVCQFLYNLRGTWAHQSERRHGLLQEALSLQIGEMLNSWTITLLCT